MVEQSRAEGRPRGIIIVASLMILFGLAEITTAFSGNFFGVITANTTSAYTYSSALIGAFYSLAGILILTTKRLAAVVAIILLGADILGRVALVLTGLYPFNGIDAGSIVAGTAIAALFALYIGLRLNRFHRASLLY